MHRQGSAEVITRLPFEETASNRRASPPGDHFPRLITLLCSFECLAACNEPAPRLKVRPSDEVDALRSAPMLLFSSFLLFFTRGPRACCGWTMAGMTRGFFFWGRRGGGEERSRCNFLEIENVEVSERRCGERMIWIWRRRMGSNGSKVESFRFYPLVSMVWDDLIGFEGEKVEVMESRVYL